jgi:Domain of unknown function (DUF4145)
VVGLDIWEPALNMARANIAANPYRARAWRFDWVTVMAQVPFTPATYEADGFNCPHANCKAFAGQLWATGIANFAGYTQDVEELRICRCARCHQNSLWWSGSLILPDISTAPPPNADFPPDLLGDYEEAASILSRSPRGSTALLRLVVQKLCKHLGETGENINADIGSLVQKGLPIGVQQALDSLRVIGNNAVHPGQIDLSDDEGTAVALFALLNFIVEKLISDPAEINRLKAYPVVPGAGHSGSRGRFEGRGEGAASLVAKGADHANWPPPAAAVRPGRPKLQEGATWDNGISHIDSMVYSRPERLHKFRREMVRRRVRS